MKRTLFVLSGLAAVFLCLGPTALKEPTVGRAEVFASFPSTIHGIAFAADVMMYLGQRNTILTVTPGGETAEFLTLPKNDAGKDVFISNMAFGPDHRLYIAAGDRVFRVAPDGGVEILIEGGFSGQWGAADICLDEAGNIYVTHGATVSRFTPDLVRADILQAARHGVVDLAGLAFDQSMKILYVAAPNENKVLKYKCDNGQPIGEPEVFDIPCFPQFVAVGANGDVFINAVAWGLVRLRPDGTLEWLPCGDLLTNPCTLAFGRGGFDPNSVYVISFGTNSVVRVYAGTAGARR